MSYCVEYERTQMRPSIKMIKLTSIFLATWLCAGAAIAERLTYPAFGFSFEPPQGWTMGGEAEVRENLKKLKFGTTQFKSLVEKYARTPFINLMQHPEPHPELNPSFRVNTRNGHLANPKQMMTALIAQFSTVFPNFAEDVEPTDAQIGGKNAAMASFTYFLELEDGSAAFPVRSTLYLVPNGDHFFIVGVGAPNPTPIALQRDLDKLIASVQIE